MHKFSEFPKLVQQAHADCKRVRFDHIIGNLYESFKSNNGSITFVSGPMKSGKSSFLFEFRKAMNQYEETKSFHYFQPSLNTRDEGIDSREYDEKIYANVTNASRDIINFLHYESIILQESVIFIDEVQFYDEEIIDVIEYLRLEGSHVVLCGLDMDFRGLPFELRPVDEKRHEVAMKAAGFSDMIRSKTVGDLMAMATHVVKLSARTIDGEEATHSLKLTGGKDIVEVGDENYLPGTANQNPFVRDRVVASKQKFDLEN